MKCGRLEGVVWWFGGCSGWLCIGYGDEVYGFVGFFCWFVVVVVIVVAIIIVSWWVIVVVSVFFCVVGICRGCFG